MANAQNRRSRALTPALAALLLAAGFLCPAPLYTAPLAKLAARRGQPGSTKVRGQKATAAIAEVNVAVGPRVQELKEQLRRTPTQAAVAALERLWQPTDVVTDIVQLQGEWDVRGPKENGVRGWMSGDLPRMLLDLYSGDFGRMLSMELERAPTLKIGSDGMIETRTNVRWGIQRDEVLLFNKLKVIGTNHIRETPRAVRSSALKLTLPLLQPARDIRITYYDGELLVVRDGRGIVDVLWRRGGSRWLSAGGAPSEEEAAVGAEAAEDEEEEHEEVQEEASEDAAAQAPAVQLLNEVETLKESLEEQRRQAAEDLAERKRLLAEVAHLEASLEKAAVGSKADSVKLDTLENIKGASTQATESQREISEEKARMARALETEVAELDAQAEQLRARVSRYQVQEETLRSQIKVLEQELRVGPRDSWPAYRVAVSKARDELKEVQNELRTTKKEVSTLQRDLGRKSADLGKLAKEAEAQAAVRMQLEDRLTEQRRELMEQRAHLATAVTTEQALRAELDDLRAQLDAVMAREAKGREYAEAVEGEIGEIVTQVREARKVAKTLGAERSSRGFWPFR